MPDDNRPDAPTPRVTRPDGDGDEPTHDRDVPDLPDDEEHDLQQENAESSLDQPSS